jgi:hypothetical protein
MYLGISWCSICRPHTSSTVFYLQRICLDREHNLPLVSSKQYGGHKDISISFVSKTPSREPKRAWPTPIVNNIPEKPEPLISISALCLFSFWVFNSKGLQRDTHNRWLYLLSVCVIPECLSCLSQMSLQTLSTRNLGREIESNDEIGIAGRSWGRWRCFWALA